MRAFEAILSMYVVQLSGSSGSRCDRNDTAATAQNNKIVAEGTKFVCVRSAFSLENPELPSDGRGNKRIK